MEDSASKLRLVRCPKCENVLSELPDYSVYQCGGCGAILRANKSNVDGVATSGKPEKMLEAVKIGAVSEKMMEVVKVGAVSSEKSEIFSGKPEDCPREGTILRVQSGESRKVCDTDGASENVVDNNGPDEAVPKRAVENGKLRKADLANGSSEHNKVEELKSQNENMIDSRTPGQIFKQRIRERVEREGTGRIRRVDVEEATFSTSADYGAQGTSRYHVDGLRNQGGISRSSRVDAAEPDREELLRKLEELKDQLSRCDLKDKLPRENVNVPSSKRMAHPEHYAESDDWIPDHSSTGLRHASRQFYGPTNNGRRPQYMEDYHEPLPSMTRSAVHNPMRSRYHHLSVGPLDYVPGCEDSFETQMLGRHPQRRIPHHYQHQRSYLYMSGQYVGPEPAGHFEPHPLNTVHNQIPCSCYECFDKHQQTALEYPSSSCCNRRFPHVGEKHIPYLTENHGPQGYASRMVKPPLVGPYDAEPRARMARDNLDLGGPTHSRPQRAVLANGSHYHPVAGGAPFVTCHNCFELLQIPKSVVNSGKASWKVSCGSCSSVVSLAIIDEKLVSVDPPSKRTMIEPLDSSNEIAHDKPYDACTGMKLDSFSFHSEEYDNSGYDFQSAEREPVSSSTGQGVNSIKSDELQNLHSLSPTTSEEEDYPYELVARHGRSATAEMPAEATLSDPLSGSPPDDHFDYTSKYRAVNRCGKGSLSSRSDQERVISSKSVLRQNSLKESRATEMEISMNDYGNNGASQESTDSREDEQPKSKKGVDSFLAGIIKKSFRDFGRSNQAAESCKRNVSVNGHPIPDRLVKKAEKLAGPIAPGHYWYDFRGGFWGVMGGPCMGIVMPHIEEFNYPLVGKCAAGNTRVFVNGRELHQKDLDLLSSRGLPTTRDKSYLIEISGRVVDEDTGIELDSLGKLAPTLEKVKHGFGMSGPKATAA